MFGSLYFKQSEEERSLAEEFVGVLTTSPPLSSTSKRESYIDLSVKTKLVEDLFSQYFGPDETLVIDEEVSWLCRD